MLLIIIEIIEFIFFEFSSDGKPDQPYIGRL